MSHPATWPTTINTQPTDLYAVLRLLPDASTAQISHAYRALLREHHPDTRTIKHIHQAAASDVALQQILAAYAVLGDVGRRADYDLRRGPPSRHGTRQNVPVYRTHADPTLDPPIQAGPVRWHAQYGP
jgi:curved DNA-binding protein CbpA